ncbi:hypothetical protein [Scytonema sp. NUACC26]
MARYLNGTKVKTLGGNNIRTPFTNKSVAPARTRPQECLAQSSAFR